MRRRWIYFKFTMGMLFVGIVMPWRACWAVFYHSISTDEKPQHHCCPEGADSWCKFQRALALDQNPPPHSAKIQADIGQYIKPVFDDLCKEHLLEKCLLGATQNRSESFNNLIWARAPKTEFVTRPTVEIAVSQSAIIFNSGRQALLPIMDRLQMNPGPLCRAHLASKDFTRIRRSQTSSLAVAKRQRKSKRAAEKESEEAHTMEEGTTYVAGGF